MQTLYKLTANNPRQPYDPPIATIHTDYEVVSRMSMNMQHAGWKVKLEFASVSWKEVAE